MARSTCTGAIMPCSFRNTVHMGLTTIMLSNVAGKERHMVKRGEDTWFVAPQNLP